MMRKLKLIRVIDLIFSKENVQNRRKGETMKGEDDFFHSWEVEVERGKVKHFGILKEKLN